MAEWQHGRWQCRRNSSLEGDQSKILLHSSTSFGLESEGLNGQFHFHSGRQYTKLAIADELRNKHIRFVNCWDFPQTSCFHTDQAIVYIP